VEITPKKSSNIKFCHLVAAHQRKPKHSSKTTKFLISTYSFTSVIQVLEFLQGSSYFTKTGIRLLTSHSSRH